MQNAKDTFYITLRDRIAALNPTRTVLVRGQSRPAVLVEENELPSAYEQSDAFRLRWTAVKLDTQGPLPFVTIRCEILYATAGSSGNGGMDRGRMLAAMDAELAAALNGIPQRAAKASYSATGTTAMNTTVSWSDVSFAAAELDGELVRRTATVDIFTWQEEGEL